jgi:colanic acid/amylovoran biosynthesis protein
VIAKPDEFLIIYGVRILLLPGTYDCKNLGDLAMLQVAVDRLVRELPGSAIRALTYTPEALQRFCPQVQPVSFQEWQRWRKAKIFPHWFGSQPETRFRHNHTRLFARLWRLKAGLLRGKYLAGRNFLEEIRRADAFVVTGCGLLNDHFVELSLEVLELLQIAIDCGSATALFSQGIGPLTDATLRRRAAEVLPLVDTIFIRESHSTPLLLDSLGVSPERIVFTGDDAVELAWSARRESLGTHIAFNLRVATYSGVPEGTLAVVRSLLAQKAAQYGARLLGVPIARGNVECDVATAQRMLNGLDVAGDPGTDIDTPLKAIRRTAECRIVVTGSYHLAVFALSQGIPAVCVARNQYYRAKFLGVAKAFATGCTVLEADAPAFESSLARAIDRLWREAPALREPLLREAECQVELANAAYTECLSRLLPGSMALRSAAPSMAFS